LAGHEIAAPQIRHEPAISFEQALETLFGWDHGEAFLGRIARTRSATIQYHNTKRFIAVLLTAITSIQKKLQWRFLYRGRFAEKK
jgi:hypothetical protein